MQRLHKMAHFSPVTCAVIVNLKNLFTIVVFPVCNPRSTHIYFAGHLVAYTQFPNQWCLSYLKLDRCKCLVADPVGKLHGWTIVASVSTERMEENTLPNEYLVLQYTRPSVSTNVHSIEIRVHKDYRT